MSYSCRVLGTMICRYKVCTIWFDMFLTIKMIYMPLEMFIQQTNKLMLDIELDVVIILLQVYSRLC